MKIPVKLRNALFLCALLTAGFALRAYNLGFPSIGYHNMLENEYLGMAHEMERSGDYLTKRVYFDGSFGMGTGVHADKRPPLVSYQTLLAWRIFGENVWAPRLFNVIFGVASIFIIYLMGCILFDDRRAALFSAAVLAMAPLAVFFSRNLQPESPALFFMLLGSLFYLRFISKHKRSNLFLGGLSFLAAFFYRQNFIAGILPLVFLFPLAAKDGERKNTTAYAFSLLLPFALALLFSLQDFSIKRLFDIYTAAYWKGYGRVIWAYMVTENFTGVLSAAAFLGMLFAFFKRRALVDRYIIGWTLAATPYAMIYAVPLSENNFYQMPFLALVCISSAYAVSRASDMVKTVIKKDIILILMLIVVSSASAFAYDSLMRMHSTVFMGADVAGESLKGFTKPDERVFLLTHAQGRCIARYARRYAGWTNNIDDFKEKEKGFNKNYICIYPLEFVQMLKMKSPKVFEYIRKNYHIKEAGLTEEPRRFFYLILEKGGLPDGEDFSKPISGNMRLKTIYKLSGRYAFFYIVRRGGA